jgi:hypothetical protein
VSWLRALLCAISCCVLHPAFLVALLLVHSSSVSADDWRPVAIEDEAVLEDNSPLTIDVLSNDSQLDDKPLVLTVTVQPTQGSVSVEQGKLVYAPNPDFAGTDKLAYQVTDSHGDSDWTTVTVTRERKLFDKLAHKGFRLQRAITGPDAGQGATASFLTTDGEGTVFATNFALLWNPGDELVSTDTMTAAFSASVEGALSSDDSKAENALRFRTAIDWDFVDLAGLDGGWTSTALKFETDQKFNTQKWMFEGLFSPTKFSWAIGRALPHADFDDGGRAISLPPVQFLWRPFVGIDAGYTGVVGSSAEDSDTVLRMVGRLRTTLLFNSLADFLDIPEVSLYADDTLRYLPLNEDNEAKNFLTVGLDFKLSQYFSFGLLYKNGQDAPTFERIRTFGGNIGLQFGGR